MNKYTIQKIIQRILHLSSYYTQDILKKFRMMDKYEKGIIIGSSSVFLMVLCTPLMTISPNDTTKGLQYVFLITEISLWKSLFFIQGSLLLSLLWLFNNKFKIYVVENLGFQGNNYLFLLFLFGVSTTTLISIGEIVNVLTVYTTILSLTALYYGSLIILILLLSLCFYLSFYTSNKYFKGHVVGYHGRKPYKEVDSDGSLFDSLSDRDE